MQIVTNNISSSAAVTGFSSEDPDAGAKQQRYAQYKVSGATERLSRSSRRR
jgi:hypothetical protein